MEKKRKHKRLSITELKSFEGFDNYTDQQAEEAIATLEKLSILLFELHQKRKMIIENNKSSSSRSDDSDDSDDSGSNAPTNKSQNTSSDGKRKQRKAA